MEHAIINVLKDILTIYKYVVNVQIIVKIALKMELLVKNVLTIIIDFKECAI